MRAYALLDARTGEVLDAFPTRAEAEAARQVDQAVEEVDLPGDAQEEGPCLDCPGEEEAPPSGEPVLVMLPSHCRVCLRRVDEEGRCPCDRWEEESGPLRYPEDREEEEAPA